jgi:hypothetical protein
VAYKLTVFDHEVDVKLVVLPDLRLGAIHAQSPQVIVTNLSGVAQRFGLHADAIVGMDILRLGSFAIDYRQVVAALRCENPSRYGKYHSIPDVMTIRSRFGGEAVPTLGRP